MSFYGKMPTLDTFALCLQKLLLEEVCNFSTQGLALIQFKNEVTTIETYSKVQQHIDSLLTKKQRQFLIIAFGSGINIWNIAFEVGAWNTVLYNNLMLIWGASLITLFYVLFVADRVNQFSKFEVIAITLPSCWFLAVIINSLWVQSEVISEILHYSSFIVILICIPALLYFVLLIIERDALLLDIKSYIRLFLLLALMAGMGFITGKYNYIFFSCSDFMYAGSYEPKNCRAESAVEALLKEE